MKKVAVYTSGGDAPGMNACIRAVVRGAIYHGAEIFGIRYGYNGMIKGDIKQLNSYSVSNIIQKGGTILKSARRPSIRSAILQIRMTGSFLWRLWGGTPDILPSVVEYVAVLKWYLYLKRQPLLKM